MAVASIPLLPCHLALHRHTRGSTMYQNLLLKLHKVRISIRLKTCIYGCLTWSGPDIECSKATGYSSSASREIDRGHSTQSVKGRSSCSSSRYICSGCTLCKAEI